MQGLNTIILWVVGSISLLAVITLAFPLLNTLATQINDFWHHVTRRSSEQEVNKQSDNHIHIHIHLYINKLTKQNHKTKKNTRNLTQYS